MKNHVKRWVVAVDVEVLAFDESEAEARVGQALEYMMVVSNDDGMLIQCHIDLNMTEEIDGSTH